MFSYKTRTPKLVKENVSKAPKHLSCLENIRRDSKVHVFVEMDGGSEG